LVFLQCWFSTTTWLWALSIWKLISFYCSPLDFMMLFRNHDLTHMWNLKKFSS
jgi:hypothetical protein